MESENKFWVVTWTIVAIAVCFVVVSVLIEDVMTKSMVSKAVESGANPVEMGCSLGTIMARDCVGLLSISKL